MPITQRHHHALQLALILLLCALVLGACSREPAGPPNAEPAAPSNAEPAAPANTEPAAQQEVVEPQATDAPAEPTEVIVAALVTPEPTVLPESAETEEAVDEPAPLDAEEPAEEAEETEPEAVATPTPAPPRLQVSGAVATLPREHVVSAQALVIRDDETVAPPLSIAVSANRQLEGYRFKVSGLLRNDAEEPYARLGVIATFFRADGSRYGPIRAKIQCPILGPGDVCPFIIEATDKTLTEVMLHPEGRPTDRRQSMPVELRTTGRYVDTIGYVHITGSVYNPNPVAVQDITINGVLLDDGQIVSMGADLILGPLDSGASAPFDVMVRYVPYSQAELYAQALPR